MTQPRPPALRTDRAKPHRCRRYSLLIYHNQLLRALRGPRSPISEGRPLKVLYLFSGVARQLDMATCLQQLAAAWTLDLRTECMDIKRNAKLDLSLPKVRNSYLDRIRAKEFDAILLSPPCASFSRATWANFRGPRPVRSYELPRGLEKLTPVERDRAILGNIFADFSFEIATLVAEGAATFLAMEQPEDLGALPTGPHEGLRPASMWQWPQQPTC